MGELGSVLDQSYNRDIWLLHLFCFSDLASKSNLHSSRQSGQDSIVDSAAEPLLLRDC